MRERMMVIWALLLIAVILAYSLGLVDVDAWLKAARNLSVFASDLYIRYDLLQDALSAVGETFVIALFGTVVGALISYPLSAMSAQGITARWLSLTIRTMANVLRTVPAIFWGILFVVMFGPGNVAGAVALALYTAGYLSKFFYETFENVGKEHYEALGSLGIPWMVMAKALFKHTEKQMIGHMMFMFEYNLRTASIMGIVGAGGIGYYITQYVSILNYSAAFTFFIVILLFVFLVDGVSYVIRKRM
ncbi:MAG: ABC transporter permease subunit [Candidatus Nitrosocaldus sp.]|nr:ABC transporter permease subunit [Candidatus Nitrosocaldus sp.]